jgi:hypothetical protein
MIKAKKLRFVIYLTIAANVLASCGPEAPHKHYCMGGMDCSEVISARSSIQTSSNILGPIWTAE